MTQVSWFKQLTLAIVLFVFGSLAYWLEYSHKPKKEAEQEQTRKVLSLKDTPVQSITLTADGKVFELACSDMASKMCKPGDNSKWQVEKPLKLKADDSNVNSLLSAMNNLNAVETINLKEETPEKRSQLLKDYGLDPQALAAGATRKLSVRTDKGEMVVYLGATHPIGESIFALRATDGKVADTEVYLVPNYFKSNFEHDLTYWREKKLLTLAAHEVSSFELNGERNGEKTKISGVRKDGGWSLKSGSEEFAGDIENVDALLNAVGYLTAKDFTSDNKTDEKAKETLKGAKPLLTLTLQKEKAPNEKEASAPIQLSLYEKGDAKAKAAPAKPGTTPTLGPKLYATVSNLDPLYELDAHVQNQLNKSVKDLRLSKLISSMERFNAKKLEFAAKSLGDKPLTLIQESGKWLLQPEKAEAALDKVNATLDKLSGNRIQEFLTGKAFPQGEADGLKLTLGDDKVDAKRQFVFWKNDNKLYARDLLSKRNEAFVVDKAIDEALPWNNRDFFKKPAGSSATPPPASVNPNVEQGHTH